MTGKIFRATGMAAAVAFGGLVCAPNARAAEADAEKVEWTDLFNGKDLSGWDSKPGTWVVDDDGILSAVAKGSIWSQETYGDFVLSLEFKMAEKTNSGVFIRTGDPANSVQTGIEIQVIDDASREEVDKHSCGAIYDLVAPSKSMVKPAGEWNRLIIRAKGSNLSVRLNKEQICKADLDLWTEARKSPDGSKNKFKTAVKDFPRVGHIGFQYHGHPVWFKDVRIREL